MFRCLIQHGGAKHNLSLALRYEEVHVNGAAALFRV